MADLDLLLVDTLQLNTPTEANPLAPTAPKVAENAFPLSQSQLKAIALNLTPTVPLV